MKKIFLIMFIICWTYINGFSVSTMFWEQSHKRDFYRGDLDNVMVSGDGKLTLTNKIKNIFDNQAIEFVWSMEANKDKVYWGTGNTARLYEYDIKNDKYKIVIEYEKELGITSLYYYKKNLYIGTFPSGKIFCYTGKNKIEELCDLPDTYIWSLNYFDGHLIAGTGGNGRIYKIDLKTGKYSVLAETIDENILVMAVSPDDKILYAGGSPNGIVYKIDREGKISVVMSIEQDEIRGIISTGEDELYVAANLTAAGRKKGKSNARFIKTIKEGTDKKNEKEKNKSSIINNVMIDKDDNEKILMQDNTEKIKDKVQKVVSPFMGSKKGTVYRVKQETVEKVYEISDQYVFCIELLGNYLYAGTGSKGNLYRIDTSTDMEYLVKKFQTGQVLCLKTHKGNLYLGTGTPGKIYEVSKEIVTEGTYISPVNDCIYQSVFGAVHFRGDNTEKVSIQLKTGNYDDTDIYWTDWSDRIYYSGDKVNIKKGRFVKFKLTMNSMEKQAPVLDSIRLSYLMDNQRPEIYKLEIDKLVKQRAFSDNSENNNKDNNSTAELNYKIESSADNKKTVRDVRWTASDLDGDRLVYDLYYKYETGNYIKINNDNYIYGSEIKWETKNVPDGKYRLKIKASDILDNPADNVKENEYESDYFIIDNTEPAVYDFKYSVKDNVISISFICEDKTSLIAKVEYSYDNNFWYIVYPEDRIYDSKKEKFAFNITGIKKGEYNIVVKIYDEKGNLAKKKEFIKIGE